MRFGSVCSGIEAASVAFGPLGWEAAWFSEIEPFPSAVLAHHYPSVPNLGDMTAITKKVLTGEVEAPDMLCGGTPCQAFSVAGLRESLQDQRGNLTLKFVELADAVDHVRVRAGNPAAIVFWENVPGVLSTADNAFGCFLAGLAGEDAALEPPGGRWSNSGAVYGPARAVAWRTLDAQYFGVAQRRRRVFVVASARAGFDPAAVLFEWDGLRRDSAPSREPGQSPAGHAAAGAGIGIDFQNCADTGDLAGTLMGEAQKKGGQAGHGVLQLMSFRENQRGEVELVGGDGHTVQAISTGGGKPGQGYPAVAYSTKLHNTQSNQAGKVYEEYATSLDANSPPPAVFQPVVGALCRDSFTGGMGGRPEGAAAGHVLPVAFPANLSGTQCASTENLAPAMGAKNPTAVAVALRGREGGATAELGDEVQNCLRASSGGGDKPHVLAAMQVRRLTPRECERLQGFPDDYTAIPWRGKPADQCPDGPRYKALGNSWAVPVVRWIGRRIDAALAAAERRAA